MLWVTPKFSGGFASSGRNQVSFFSWSRPEREIAPTMKIKILAAVLLLAIAATATYTIKYSDGSKIQEIKVQEPVEPPHDKLDRWIDRLASEYECQGCPPRYRRIDSNGLYSYGCLQFQERTFVNAVKIYSLLPDAEPGEYLNQIYDCDFQKEVARAMLLHELDACYHWQTSVLRGAGAPPLPAKSCSLI